MDKKQARKYVKEIKKTLSESEVIERSKNVINRIYGLLQYKNSVNILTYVNYNQEVVTKELINVCLADGKNVYVPKVHGKEMKFHRINSLDDLKPGAYGILEPVTQYTEDVSEGLMIMPGVAFDKKLNRAGYGGGFYDKYLEKHPDIYKAAVCFDFQVVDEIETENYDLKPDVLVMESGVLVGNTGEYE